MLSTSLATTGGNKDLIMPRFTVRQHIVLMKEFEVDANTPEEAVEIAPPWDKRKELLEYEDSWYGDTEVYDDDCNLLESYPH